MRCALGAWKRRKGDRMGPMEEKIHLKRQQTKPEYNAHKKTNENTEQRCIGSLRRDGGDRKKRPNKKCYAEDASF